MEEDQRAMSASPSMAPRSSAEISPRLILHAAGFNAHGQLLPSNGKQDVFSFTTLIPSAQDAESSQSERVLFTGWSSTALIRSDQMVILGHQPSTQTPHPASAHLLREGFGDHDALLGCLDTDGRLYTTHTGFLVPCDDDAESSPKIGHVALAGNGKVAISFKQAPNGRLCHILYFSTLDELVAWYRDPAGTKLDPENQHFMIPGRPAQLVAGTATFAVLMEGGEVYTWGDPRYRSLGREIGLDAPAERPALVEALGGVKIVKLAAGGWMNAAVSEDRAGYIWGTGTPGTDSTIAPLREAGAGEVVLVEISEAGEVLDVTDVGVGDNHVAVVVEDRQLFVVGDNPNGQLGLGEDAPDFVDEWTEVLSDRDFRHVVCGPSSTLVWKYVDWTP